MCDHEFSGAEARFQFLPAATRAAIASAKFDVIESINIHPHAAIAWSQESSISWLGESGSCGTGAWTSGADDASIPDLDESSDSENGGNDDSSSEVSDLDDDCLKCGNCDTEASTADVSSGDDVDEHTYLGRTLRRRRRSKVPANAGDASNKDEPIERLKKCKSPRRLQKKVRRRRAKAIRYIKDSVLKMADKQKAAVIRACATLIGTDGENVDVPDAPIHGLGRTSTSQNQMLGQWIRRKSVLPQDQRRKVGALQSRRSIKITSSSATCFPLPRKTSDALMGLPCP